MPDQHYLGFERDEILDKGGLDTATEIAGQPVLWREVYDLVLLKSNSLDSFLRPVFAISNLRVILTGAGSSAFVGEAAQGIFQSETGKLTQAIASTDLVTHPSLYFLKDIPTLMVSFARSGNSPESYEAVRLANICCNTIFHLIITCNKNGDLLHHTKGKNVFTLLLPEKANDKSLAMTGSFTSMLLTIVLIAKLNKINAQLLPLKDLIETAKELLENYVPLIRDVSNHIFDRVIFLGSGPLLGIARECHLKLQELTDGKVICKHDSFLGFRHGPRAVTNKKSLVIYLFSGDDKVFQYEKDLASSISSDSPEVPVIAVGRKIPGLQNVILHIEFVHSNEFVFIAATLLGQLMGFYQSIRLGLQPDNPSVSGSINRVVQGVTIYS
jgi:tagatose-6-phosphate ketose/aldose isomerase